MIPVCVFAKPPRPGKVKTRIAQILGDEAAALLASAMFCDVWRAVSSCPGVRPILATTESGAFPVSIPADDVWLQGEGDLGARLERILCCALDTASAAIAIGADSPLLTPHHLQAARQALQTHDAVLGPAHDGGFYLLGLTRCPPGLLFDLPWSTPETYSATLQRLQEHAFSVSSASDLFDVDTPGDLPLLVSSVRDHPSTAPATHAWLLENGFLEQNRDH